MSVLECKRKLANNLKVSSDLHINFTHLFSFDIKDIASGHSLMMFLINRLWLLVNLRENHFSKLL